MSEKINWEAWASFFFFGYPLGTSSYTLRNSGYNKGENALPVDRVYLTCGAQAISDYDFAVQQAAELFLHVLNAKLLQRELFKPVVFLSGGWDSRAILAGIRKVAPNKSIEAFTTTYDGGNNKEQVFAAQVADYLNVPHTIIDLDEDYYQKYSDQAMRECGFSTNMHIWMHNFLAKSQLSKSHVNFDGYAGDLLFRGMKQSANDSALSADSDEFFRRFRIQIPSSVLSKPVYNTLEKLARKALSDELSKYPSETRTLNFLINNRGARAVGYSISAQKKYIEVELPFMDKALLQLTADIDPEIRLRPSFYPDILKRIDAKVATIPSTNSPESEQVGWSPKPILKHSADNLAHMLDEIKSLSSEGGNAAGIVDWFTLDPKKVVNSEREQPFLRRHNQALESVYLYTKWFKLHKAELAHNNLLCDAFDRNKTITTSQSPSTEENFDAIKAEYISNITELETKHRLHFNLTVDVEAFPIGDYYASQTAHENELDKLIFADFGEGSLLEAELLSKEIPCTYFIESYSSLLKNDGDFKRVIEFFDRPHAEIGLHCHAFSIDEDIIKHLNLTHEWYRDKGQLTDVLRWGKRRIEGALTESSSLTSFRSGRLDIYPSMETCIKCAGFAIDSSLMDSVEDNYFEFRSSSIGNGIYETSNLTEVPLTSFRTGQKVRGLNFNSTSFEHMCHLVYLAVKFKLPCLTMLLHSWSFGRGGQPELLGKNIQTASDAYLIEKFRHLVDFVNRVSENVKFSTIRESASSLTLSSETTFLQPAEKLNLKPELISVSCKYVDGMIIASTSINTDFMEKEYVYAFYLLANGEVIQKNLYQKEPYTTFDIKNSSLEATFSVRGYVKETGATKPLVARTVEVI